MSKKCFHDKNLNSCEYCSVITKIRNQTNVSFGNLWKLTQEIHAQMSNGNKNNLKLNALKNVRIPITPLQKQIAARILMNPKDTRGYPFLYTTVVESLENRLKKR